MDLTSGALLSLAIGGLMVGGFAAIGAKVLHEFSRHELEELCRRRRRLDLFGQILDHHEQVALGVESLQVVGTVLLVAAGLLWARGPGPHDSMPAWQYLMGGVLAGCLLLLAATVWIPWAIVRLGTAPFLFHTWRIWLITSKLLAPMLVGARLVDALAYRLAGRTQDESNQEEAFEDEIRSIVTEGLREGLLEADAREMIEGVIELGDADVSDVMTPRSRVDALALGLSWSEVLQFVIRVRRTRIPVYEKKLDNIIGILYVKDLLGELANDRPQQRRPLHDVLRKPWFVPKTKAVDDLLREFLKTHNHMAIVVDEYQAVAGVVTIEDVLEEIVGEIVDEHDQESEEEIRQIDDHTAEVLGHAHLDEINQRLALQLPEEDEFDTIGGLVISRLGHIPKQGEHLQWNNVRITVLQATRRRIERVQIHVLQSAKGEGG